MSYQVDITKFKSFPQFKERFLSYFPKNYNESYMLDLCWEWQGAISRSGYGNTCYGCENYLAHRMSYIIFNGPIRSDQLIRHTCDNPKCVNPNHLITGNNSDNSIDMVKRNPRSNIKLNEEAVKVIKWMLKYQYEKGLGRKLAKAYKISPSIISRIHTNKYWSWVKV